jgi:PAS domain S-box-containing protein
MLPPARATATSTGAVRWRERWHAFIDQIATSEEVDGPNASRFRASQVLAVSRLFPLVVLGNVVNSGAIAVMFHDKSAWISIWFAVVVIGLLTARTVWRQMVHPGPVPRASRSGMTLLVSLVTAFAATWITVPIALFAGADHNGQMLLATVVVGMMCAGGFILSAHPLAATAYVCVLAVGSVVGLMSSRYASFPALVLMLLVYAGTLLAMVIASAQVFMSRLRADAEAERQAQLVDLLLKDFEAHASDWLWEIAPEGHLRHISARLTESLGAQATELERMPFLTFLRTRQPEGHAEAQQAMMRLTQLLQLGQSFRDVELALMVGGELRWCSLTAKPLTDDLGRHAGWRGVGSDITHARRTRDELARLANQDTLTGLANRYRFGRALHAVLSQSDARTDRGANLCEIASESL